MVRFMLMDDTGSVEFPVVLLNVRNMHYDNRVYEDVDDAATYLLKVIKVYEIVRGWAC